VLQFAARKVIYVVYSCSRSKLAHGVGSFFLLFVVVVVIVVACSLVRCWSLVHEEHC